MPFNSLREWLRWNRFDPAEGIRQVMPDVPDPSIRNLLALNFRQRNILLPNQLLIINDRLMSSNHLVKLKVESSGRLILYRSDNGKVLWSPDTSIKELKCLVMKNNGDLVAYDKNDTLCWHSNTQGYSGSILSLADNGNLVIIDSSGKQIWETKTEQDFSFLENLFLQDDIKKIVSLGGFDYDAEQDIFYSRLDPWQDNFGYLNLYDELSPLALMFIHCEPIRFNYPDEKKSWKIELWKGRYGIFVGAEIGVYTGEFEINTGIEVIDHSFNSFDSDKDTQCASGDDMLQMSFTLYKNGKPLFRRNSDDPDSPEIEKHWWLTGFKLEFDPLVDYDSLSMDINIVLKDIKMRNSFVDAMVALGYQNSQIHQNGNAVSFTFTKPYTKEHQPFLKPF